MSVKKESLNVIKCKLLGKNTLLELHGNLYLDMTSVILCQIKIQ